MFKIEFDRKVTNNFINFYFSVILWFALLVAIVQISKEKLLIIYLITSIFVFLMLIIGVFMNYRILKVNAQKMKKKDKKILIAKREKQSRIYRIITGIIIGAIFISVIVFIILNIERISSILLIIILTLIMIWISFVVLNKINAQK